MMSQALLKLVLVSVLVMSGNVSAFELTGTFWAEGRTPMRIQNFPQNNPPANTRASNSDSEIHDAFVDAMNLWTNNSSFLFSNSKSLCPIRSRSAKRRYFCHYRLWLCLWWRDYCGHHYCI